VKELHGAYAIAVIDKRDPDRMVAARMGCPLLVGLGEGENFVASDVSAIVSSTRRVIFLEEGDTAELTRESVKVFDADGAPIERDVHVSDVSLASLELGPYRHFMQKEIHEQPRAVADTIEAVIDNNGFSASLFGAGAEDVMRDVEACRSSRAARAITPAWSRVTGSNRSSASRARSTSPANTAIAKSSPIRSSSSSPSRSRAKRSTRWKR
jgi:glucosamine 6-phosphate synthetase-like amidotransferase/phosphosugar isomerase protein